MQHKPAKIIAENRRARLDYDILDTLEAGVELKGFEVKSAKGGHLSLSGAYAAVQQGQLWLVNAIIPPYQPRNTPASYNPKRSRRLLCRAAEIARLAEKAKEKYVLIPLRAELRHGLVKIILAVARARQKQDKREYLKKRDAQKEMRHIE